MKYSQIINTNDAYDKDEQFVLLEKLIQLFSNFSFLNKNLFELALYSHFIEYLKLVCLKIYYKNLDELSKDNVIMTIFESYCMLLNNLDLTYYIDSTKKVIVLKDRYILSKNDIRKLNDKVDNNISNPYIKKYFLSYDFIIRCQNNKEKFKTPTSKYIYYLIIYTRQLERISFTVKQRPQFEENFYTDLGEFAFQLFNKANYCALINKKQVKYILDVGCGNGDIIETFLEHKAKAEIFGVERQKIVYKKLMKKYGKQTNVKIFNDDIRNLVFNEMFDLINISYMLFYLELPEQKSLFDSLYKLLDDNGEIIICQYFPEIENIQMRIAQNQNEWNKIHRYKFKISNSILYSEVLLNDALIDFNHAVRFNEFCEIVKNTGFYISDINKADNNYYSFYITLCKEKKND